jgi:hypothetical protein
MSYLSAEVLLASLRDNIGGFPVHDLGKVAERCYRRAENLLQQDQERRPKY